MNCVAIVVAAGRGSRAGGALPKQYQSVGGEPVLRHTLRAFAAHPQIAGVLPVIHDDDSGLFAEVSQGLPKIMAPVVGGESRQASVRAGLHALRATPPTSVLVHDAARPFTSAALIARAVAAANAEWAAIPVVPVTDTVKTVDVAGRVTGTLDRRALRAVQTPQAFAYGLLAGAHDAAARCGISSFTDDAAVVEWAGHRVATFEGETTNVKLTFAEDLLQAERSMEARSELAPLGDIRTGSGFDVHAFTPGDHVMLGGIPIPHAFALAGHSDADVALHALTDAILGALGDGDIGSHFPPSDPQWKGAASDRFLAHAVDLVHARGGRIAHVDLTIICEAPKVGPHREAIRTSVAGIARLPVGRVSVKATTTEKLGFTGRREGIAAMATATVRLPFQEEA
ncbi:MULTISPECIES: bifunctional 2-C-methyl-D-erythritol 4-phosphate cytidylyltransferase/2-C-methyl-D-erythritol 2,4-cyclodiphosphate synthase [unclassified Xanthobacter]|uniref:bifunctional 2-C-methyl-D-erythritol 4-phosphate cytidylyltransferase/2-C-methyl-D-erythritol 2,4-cyclodiphosphate synthase n=1 Tax=unclassified Xanthobacter TaxID=2623496 RepID=UPI001EDFE383|nr:MULTISPECIES: bifunctional 2-C-methyl-D-erythritol 4-phosphate cytidylyltransferase/2-C-methyl-D-erythritol 2,4-cyclodiphosphate synthase [unclassified Xanthobacter]